MPPARQNVLTSLLIWEETRLPADPEITDEQDLEVIEALEREGLVSWFTPSQPVRLAGPARAALPIADAINRVIDEAQARKVSVEEATHRARAIADRASSALADRLITRLAEASEMSLKSGLAPVAGAFISNFGAIAPPVDEAAPTRETALISASFTGVMLDEGTAVDAVLHFRESHRAEIGRCRGSLITLAGTLQRDTSPEQMAEEAQAAVLNRVAPALADLETAMRANKLKFMVNALAGASGLAFGPVAPAVAAKGGVQIATQALSYAFDRDRLVREHPYGYLYRAREAFGGAEDSFRRLDVVNHPVAEIHSLLRAVIRAGTSDYFLEERLGVPTAGTRRATSDQEAARLSESGARRSVDGPSLGSADANFTA